MDGAFSIIVIIIIILINEPLVVHPVQQWMILIFVLQMQDHNEKECPKAQIKCPFNILGCPFEVQQALIYFSQQNIAEAVLL